MQTGHAEVMRGFGISGFGPKDVGRIQQSAEYLGPAISDVLDALYDHLLSHPETREFFE